MNPSALTALIAAWLFTWVILLATGKPGYSHLRHTISELGETGAPQLRFVAYGLFLPVGLGMLLVAWLVRTTSSPCAVLALSIGIGYFVAALFPCDPGSPPKGTPRQDLHNLGGAAEYIGGGVSLWNLGDQMGPGFHVAGGIVLVSAIALAVFSPQTFRGLIQRVAEVCLFGGLLVALW